MYCTLPPGGIQGLFLFVLFFKGNTLVMLFDCFVLFFPPLVSAAVSLYSLSAMFAC